MGRHVMECLGKSRVVIEDGKVVEVGEPRVKSCPLFKKHRGIDELNMHLTQWYTVPPPKSRKLLLLR